MSSNTLFLSSLTCISIVFDFFWTSQSWIVFNKFFTGFFVYVKSDLNFFRLTFRSITRNFRDHFLIVMSSNTLFLSSLTCIRIVFNFFRTCQSWIIFNKFFTCFFVYVKCNLNFFRLTFWRITRYFSDNLRIDVSLNVTTFIEIRSTRELIVTDCIRCVYETFFRVFDIDSVFGLITSCFQRRHIYRRCITRYFSDNLRIDVSLNIVSFVHIRHTSELIITDCIRCIHETFFRIFNFSSIFGLITSHFQFRNIDLRSIARYFSLNLRIDMCLNIASFVCFSCTGELIITNNLRCIFKTGHI